MPEGMAPWFPPALGAAFFISVHYLLLRAASGRIGDRLGALILEGSATLGILLSFAFLARAPAVVATRAGILFAVASGLAVSVASVLLFTTLRRGGPVASAGTLVLGGGVALSALVAPWLFAESFTGRRALGVTLGLAAMWVLGGET